MQRFDQLIWSEALVSGVPEIDDQHMILVNTLNEATDLLKQEVSAEALEKITHDLLSYALYHFETEEALMRQWAYTERWQDAAAKHLAEHRRFSAVVLAIRDKLRAGAAVYPDELIGFLKNWLSHHILSTDKRLCAFILSQREGQDGKEGSDV